MRNRKPSPQVNQGYLRHYNVIINEKHYIYNNEEYYIYIYEMCIICRTYKVTYNHGKVHGETNLIDI